MFTMKIAISLTSHFTGQQCPFQGLAQVDRQLGNFQVH